MFGISLLLFGLGLAAFSILLIHEGQVIFTWLPLIGLSVALIAAGIWILLGAKPKDIIDVFFG